ncbi:MAG: hypothetical protein ABJL55_01115 [Roseibium sp.]
MNCISKLNYAIAILSMGIVAPSQAFSADNSRNYPPMAYCSLGEKDGLETYVVLHLSGFDTKGTRYYRAITSNVIEVVVKADGSVESDANPCRDELVFFSPTSDGTQ